MNLLDEEKRKKLMELPEVTCLTNPKLVVYVKSEITKELVDKIQAIMNGIDVTILKKQI